MPFYIALNFFENPCEMSVLHEIAEIETKIEMLFLLAFWGGWVVVLFVWFLFVWVFSTVASFYI